MEKQILENLQIKWNAYLRKHSEILFNEFMGAKDLAQDLIGKFIDVGPDNKVYIVE